MRDALVIVRAGPDSYHGSWLSPSRSFDLWELRYGATPPGHGDRTFHADGPKWGPLADLIDDLWWKVRKYDRVVLPDDDLIASPSSWEIFLSEARTLRLDLSQPSIVGHANWPWLAQRPWLRARIVRCVEVMTPCFTAESLEKVRETFRANVSGWGIEGLWAKALPWPERRTGVVDSVAFRHSRPNGDSGGISGLYRALGVHAGQESLKVIAEVGFHPSEEVLYEEIHP